MNDMKTALLLTITIIIGVQYSHGQTLEDLSTVDTVVIAFKESDKFHKYVYNRKPERQPCAEYHLFMGKQDDYDGYAVIYFISCRYKSEPPRDIKTVKKQWFKNKMVLHEDFFHKIGFRKSSRNSPFIGKVYYLFEESKVKSGEYQVEEVRHYSSYQGYE